MDDRAEAVVSLVAMYGDALIGRTSVSWSYNALLFIFFVTKDASPQTFCSPDARAQTLELHDLTMINEQVDVASVVLDIPCEYFRICCFEHQLVGAELINQKRRHICAPRVCVFGDSLSLNHDKLYPCLEKATAQGQQPTRIAYPFSLQLGGRRRPTCPELNANLRFGVQAALLHQLNQAQRIVHWHGNETGRNFDGVEAEFLAFADVVPHRFVPLGEHEFDEAAGRNGHFIFVAEIIDLADDFSRHQTKGATAKFQRIDISAHRFQKVLQVTFSDDGIIGAANFRDSALARFLRAWIGPQELETPPALRSDCFHSCFRND